MKKTINQTHIEGYVYEHSLEEKVSGANSKKPGTPFIAGTLSIATDADFLNVVSVHYTYVTATTSKGAPNNTYNTLKAIIDGKIQNAMEHGKENAAKVRLDSALALNEWYDMRTDGNPLISNKRNEGGFIHLLTIAEEESFKPSATFETDMLITKATRKEPDEERQQPEKMILKGYIFDFRNALLPVEYTVLAPGAMNYFESLDISEKQPLFTKVKGNQVSQTIVRTIEEEGAFGDVSVREVRSSQRDFVVTWAAKENYAWDDEETMTANELAEAIAKREVYLADVKKRQEDYQAQRDAANNALSDTTTAAPKKSDYDF